MGMSIVLWQDGAVSEFRWILVLILVHRFWKCLTVGVCIDLCHYMILSPEAGFPHFLCGPVWTNSSACTSYFKVHFYIIRTSYIHPLNCIDLHKCLLMCLLSQACWCIIFTTTAALWTGWSFTCLILDCKSMTETLNQKWLKSKLQMHGKISEIGDFKD